MSMDGSKSTSCVMKDVRPGSAWRAKRKPTFNSCPRLNFLPSSDCSTMITTPLQLGMDEKKASMWGRNRLAALLCPATAAGSCRAPPPPPALRLVATLLGVARLAQALPRPAGLVARLQHAQDFQGPPLPQAQSQVQQAVLPTQLVAVSCGPANNPAEGPRL
eukprot:CAMPEP_0175707004 /NCGR_PEP_ID=MMETSP0097-20121207/38338_1 /TAXON_ID=311494 /ORGANISM="Alexandrium monilatum, Strain CCMP3105" /LENGTH=161 /DNA_ID=CAMNT_0017014369 /DNA_START=560 /DNA_END=1046 /DNA_ORIENTATION=+